MRRFVSSSVAVVIGFMTGSCASPSRGRAPTIDPATAAQMALDSIPSVGGHLSVVRRTWTRGDTVMVQLVGARIPQRAASTADSTLVVWVAPDRHLVRRQWVMEMPTSRFTRIRK
jgi:sarcosine oxidase gamma subunit